MLNYPLVIPSFTHRRSDFAEAYQLPMQAAQDKPHCCGTTKATVLLAQLRFWPKTLLCFLAFSDDPSAAPLPTLPAQISSSRLWDTHEDRSHVMMDHSVHLAILHFLFFSCFHVSPSIFPVPLLPIKKPPLHPVMSSP